MNLPPLIYSKVAAVMADVDHVAKREVNEHQRFNFRGIDAVVNAVGPVLRKHGVVVVPVVKSCDYESASTRNGGTVTICRITADYTFWAEDGSCLTATVSGESFDSGDKSTAKAMSVCFRTALLQALALPTDEADPDSQTYERDDRPRQAVPVETPREVAARGIRDAPDAATLDRVVAWMKAEGLDADEELVSQVKARREALAGAA